MAKGLGLWLSPRQWVLCIAAACSSWGACSEQPLSCLALAQAPDEARAISYNCYFLQLRNHVGYGKGACLQQAVMGVGGRIESQTGLG